jgi:hypothetical protein
MQSRWSLKIAELPKGKKPRWFFDAKITGRVAFHKGWARGTALALETKKNGDLETYTWSQWVWLE